MKSTIKALTLAIFCIAGAMLTTSCGTPFPLGCLYTNVWESNSIGSGELEYNRRGFASCYSFLGWFAGGKATVNVAAKKGDFKKISWSTWHRENYAGIFGRYTLVVYGIGEKADPTVHAVGDYE